MELGTGIFLSAILLGLVWLYVATKDRWNWKKVILWPMAILFGIVVTGSAGFYVNDWIESRPHKETGFWGIELGASRADVKFIKGDTPYESDDPERWVYKTDDNIYYFVSFKDGRVRDIMAADLKGYTPKLQGIGSYSSFEDVVEKFGQPSDVSSSKDGLRRWFSFAKFNVGVAMEKNVVEAIAVYDASTGPIVFSEESRAPVRKP